MELVATLVHPEELIQTLPRMIRELRTALIPQLQLQAAVAITVQLQLLAHTELIHPCPPCPMLANHLRIKEIAILSRGFLVVHLLPLTERFLQADTPVLLNLPTLIKECFPLLKDSAALRTRPSLTPISRL